MLSILSSAMPNRQAEPVEGAWPFGTGAARQSAPGGRFRLESRQVSYLEASQGAIGEREDDGLVQATMPT